MKRILSVLLVAMLIVASLSMVAFAAGNAKVSASSVTAKPGDEVTITYTVSGAFANYEMTLTYDPILTLTGIDGSTGAVSNVNTAFVTWAAAENVQSHSFTVTFKVSETAQPGSYPVSATVGFVSDRNLEDQNVTVYDGAVTIASEETTTPTNPSTTPTDPSTTPTDPSTTPTEPSTAPTEPSTAPTEPSTEPSTESTEPTTQPTVPDDPGDDPSMDDEPNTGDFTVILAAGFIMVLMVPCLLVAKFRAVK